MRNEKGFTLIELIISIALFGLIAVMLTSIFSNSLFNIVRAGKRTEVVSDAEKILLGNNPTVLEERTVIVKLPVIDDHNIASVKDIEVPVSFVEGTAIDDSFTSNIIVVTLMKYNSKGSD